MNRNEIKESVKISELISKYINKSKLTDEQISSLNSWIRSSKKNRTLFNKLSNNRFYYEKLKDSSNYNIEDAYSKFLNKQRKTINYSKILFTIFKVAAVVIPVVIILHLLNSDYTKNQELIFSSNIIKHGTNKAILTLSDGTKITIDERLQDTSIVINNSNLITNKSNIKYVSLNKSKRVKYNSIYVPIGGEYKLELSDGSIAYLNSDTHIKYPEDFVDTIRKVEIVGEAFLEIKKEINKPFIVKTKNQEIRVLGTKFNVQSYKDQENIYTTLVEGRVLIKSENNKKIILDPGQQGFYVNGRLAKKNVETYLFTSWKDGRFIFEGETLKKIMKVLSRWYNIEIYFTDKEAEKIVYTGNLKRYDNFNKIIDMLNYLKLANFEIVKNRIYIRKYKK